MKDRLCECAGGSREAGDAIADTISAIYSDSVEWASAGCKFLRTGRTAQKVAPQIAALSHKLLRARERGWSVVLCADRRRGIVRIVTVVREDWRPGSAIADVDVFAQDISPPLVLCLGFAHAFHVCHFPGGRHTENEVLQDAARMARAACKVQASPRSPRHGPGEDARTTSAPVPAPIALIDMLHPFMLRHRDVFGRLDADADGTVDASELHNAFVQHGLRVSLADVEGLLADMDHNKDGRVSLDEFLVQIRRWHSESRKERAPQARKHSSRPQVRARLVGCVGPARRSGKAASASAVKDYIKRSSIA